MNQLSLKRLNTVLLLLFVLLSLSTKAQQFKNEEELKKEAERLFEEDEFTKAYNLYAQLVANYPKDPELNYRLGVCMLYSEPDKKKCYSYLRVAANSPKDAPKDATFYLAKAYHINYKFDEAIKLYNEYKKIGSARMISKLQVDREINACKNGKRLLASMQELVVSSKKQLAESDYFRSYDLRSIGGKLLVKPEQFKTSYDKRKKDKSVVYIPKAGDRVYYSSYGDNGENGRDIYFRLRLPNGEFAQPQKVPGVNTEFDEDYPFVHPNGKTLYFSSKGFNSMGGYDIFKTTFNESSGTWSPPVNMEFPINSPDDDYLFVTDSADKIAYFSTGRQSPPGKIDVLKINTERRPMDIAIIKGTVLKESAEQSLRAKITVKNMDNAQVVGVYEAAENGDYYMELPNGGKFVFTVETPGLPTQSDKVSLPLAMTMKPFKQSISYDRKVMKILNYFDSPPDEESYLRYLELIEKKAKLDVNENDVKNSPLANVTTTTEPTAVNTTNPTANGNDNKNPVISEGVDPLAINSNSTVATSTTSSKAGLNNTQLVEIAKQDAKEAKIEADKMSQDAADAWEIANTKKIEADKLDKDATDAYNAANAITNDEPKKKEALEKAIDIKQDADNAKAVATAIQNFANNLDADAKAKQKEVSLNEEYAKELEKVIANKNNKEALAKLDGLQKEIENTSKQKKQSDEAYNSIKADYDNKQAEVTKAENKSSTLRNDVAEIKKEIAINDGEISKTKDKSLKETLNGQNKELNADLDNKVKELAANEQLVAKLKEDAASAQNQIDLANKIKTSDFGTPVANNNTSVPTNTTSVAANNNAIDGLNSDYSKKLNEVADPNAKVGIEESNKILGDYNKKISDLLAIDKVDLKNAKKADEKKKINDEIKQLESQKKINDTRIAENNNKMKSLDAVAGNTTSAGSNTTGAVAANTETNTTANTPSLNATNNTQPLDIDFNNGDQMNKLANLKASIDGATNPAFQFGDYKEQSSISMKTDAELKLQIAGGTKDELAKSITAAEEDLKNNPPTTGNNPEALNKQAEVFNKKATNLKIEAESYQGVDKENMLKEARDLTSASNKKHLEAAALTKDANKNEFEINNQNIDDLITTNKSSKEDIATAQKLNDEAKTAFRQATSIRQEGDAMPTDAAKLGTMSNAEEKEVEALDKQRKAVALLQKGNPEFVVKKVDSQTGGLDNRESLVKVKQQFDQLNKEKIDAYLSLSKANQNEIKLQVQKLNAKAAIKNNTNKEAVAYKKQAETYNKEALGLISKAISEPNSSLKQSLMMEANKKEVDAIKELNNATAALEGKAAEPLATNTPKNNETKNNTGSEPVTNNTENKTGNEIKTNETRNNNTSEPVANNNGAENKTGNEVKTNETKNNTTSEPVANNNGAENKTGNEVKTNETKNNTTSEPVANSNTENKTGNEVKTNDTKNNTTSEPVANNNSAGNKTGNEVKTNETKNSGTEPVANNNATENKAGNEIKASDKKDSLAFKNVEADKMKTDALVAIKNLNEEKAKVEAEIKNASSATIPASEIKNNMNKVTAEADSLGKQARVYRSDAAAKEGAEKDTLLTKAKDLEGKSNKLKITAAGSQKELNDAQYKVNNEALTTMLANAKDKEEYAQAEQLINDANTSKKQAEDIRKEANNVPSDVAKLGVFSNAEEKEIESQMKQEQALAILKKYSPDVTVKDPVVTNNAVSPELKAKLDDIDKKQVAELEKVNTAYVMEHEASSKALPKTLNNNQKALKTNADNLIVQAKGLISKANQTPDAIEKKNLLTEATKKAEESVATLNKIASAKATSTATTPAIANNNAPRNNRNNNTSNNSGNENANKNTNNGGNDVATNNTPRNNRNNTNNAAENNTPKNNTNAVPFKVEGLEVKTSNAYSASNPIPVDQKMPDGLVFRVQIGAFKTKINDSEFKGLDPINAQTTPNGYIRYTAGNFNKFEIANAVKNDLRNLGYKDAFVVGYYNGQRITVSEAVAILEKEGKTVDLASNNSAGISANSNLPKNVTVAETPATNVTDPIVVTKELEKMNGLLFTIQIGVYSRQVNKFQLYNLTPIYTERLPSGLYRYTAGIYANGPRVSEDQSKVVNIGIKDAFVSSYFNGKRITFIEGQRIQKDSASVKMEAENPIVFGNNTNSNPNPAPAANNTAPTANNNAGGNQPTVAPFSNGVTSGPAPTAENGVKADDAGISYKVQIGAFSKQVPNETAAKFNNVKTWPIANKVINGLYLYTIGNFVNAKSAKKLKDEAVSLGITDAFVTVYKDGKKLYGAEAAGYLQR